MTDDARQVAQWHTNIRENIVFLVQYTVNLGSILQHLYQKKIISQDEAENVNMPWTTTSEKTDKLLDILLKIHYGKEKLALFIDILKKTDNKRCADKIEGIDNLSQKEDFDWLLLRRKKYARTLTLRFDLSTFKKEGIIQSLWHVPPRNPQFVGRDDLLEQMAGYLEDEAIVTTDGDRPISVTACHGLGGVGKTQLALEFVWKNHENYAGVLWFNAESINSLEEDYFKLGDTLQLFDDENFTRTRETKIYIVKHWLENPAQEGWLLVYDNAQVPGGKDGIRQYIPVKGGRVLITSRYASGWTQSFPVDIFTREESKTFLENMLPGKISEEEKDSIAEILGDLPLALAQAATCMEKMKINAPRFLELYETKRETVLNYNTLAESDIQLPYTSTTNIYTTWDATIKEISEKSPLAEKWLNCCAYLAPNNIPDYLFEAFAKNLDGNPNHDHDIYEIRKVLTSHSMLKLNQDNNGTTSTSINRVLLDVVKIKQSQEELIANCFIIANTLDNVFPGDGDEDKICELIPHLETCLEHLNLLQQEFAEEPLQLFVREIDRSILVLLIHLCNGYAWIGEDEKLIPAVERVLTIQEKHSLHPIPEGPPKKSGNIGEFFFNWMFGIVVAVLFYNFVKR